jgi:hypothetical protein
MTDETQYDVFLSHNSQDKPAVERLAHRLTDEAGLQPFLDKWHLVPGEPWQEALEQALGQSRACAVFIGPRGISPWEHEEMRAAIEQRVADRAFRVIPVLLPGAERGERGRLPAFLTRATWVEFREGLDDADALHRLVAGIKGIPPGRGPGEVVYKGVCPYRGLQVFEEEHAPFFFGREAATEWLVDDLRGSRFLAVIGPSGSGKSSLVRAGLVPALRRDDLPGSETWPLCVFRPGHRPLESLAVALIQLTSPADDPTAPLQLMDALAADQRQLHLTTRLALADAPADRTIALVVDQFEEIFTLCRDEGQRVAFIDNLLYASAIEGGRALVVLTMRADFYGKCAAYPDLAARVTDHQMLVSPMEEEEELRQAIERPARLVGLEFEGGLVETLLRDVQAEPGVLPLLQHTLLELWERREGRHLTFAAYREIGGIQGAVAHRAESIYADFDAVQQAITRRVMLRLTQPGEGTEDTRRRAQKGELLPAGEQAEITEAVIQTLADARLVTTARDMATGEEQVDVSHEALIRGWPRLREWIDEDRAGLRIHRRLTEVAQEWERHSHDESYLHRGARLAEAQEWIETHAGDLNPLERAFLEASVDDQEARRIAARRRVQSVVAGLTVAMMVFAALAFIAFQQRNIAQAEQRRAEQQSQMALSRQLAAQVLTRLDSQFDLALLLSTQAQHITGTVEARSSLLTAMIRHPRLLTFLHSPTGAATNLAFSPDGKLLVSGGAGGTVLLWDTNTWAPLGEPLPLPTGTENSVTCVAFSPDGGTLAAVDQDGRVLLWDVTSRRLLDEFLTGHDTGLWHVVFSPDGKTLASGSLNSVILWDTVTGRSLGEISEGLFAVPTSVALNSDSQILAVGNEVGNVQVWDLTTRELLGRDPLVYHDDEVDVTSLTFSLDGRTLASGAKDGSIILTDSEPGFQPRRKKISLEPRGQNHCPVGRSHPSTTWTIPR